MEILSETEKTVIDMEINISDEEKKIFIEYYDLKVTCEEDAELKINWAIVDILKKQIAQGTVIDE